MFILLSLGASGQETIKTMMYNILDFPGAFPTNRTTILRDILDDYDPDIFMVCELQSQYGADLILNTSLNHNGIEYVRAPFIPSQSGAMDHQQMIFYRKGMFSLENYEAIPTPVRDINYYQLKLSTADQDLDPVLIDIFVNHFKSSQGPANRQLRLDTALLFTDRLENMDPNSFVIFAGDLNIYTHTEPAYQELLNPLNNIVMADPVDRPGAWQDKAEFQDLHTQSTRLSSAGFGSGAGGGLDDRFDFILISENMKSDPKLMYVPNTYKAYGNNGNCLNNSINSPDCNGAFGQTLRDNLYNFSDHLPVVMDLETNKQIVLSTPKFVVGSPFTLEATLVSEKLKIQLGPNLLDNVSFEIYNTIGQKLLEHHFENQDNIIIDISQFADGVYYLRSNLVNSPTYKFLKSS